MQLNFKVHLELGNHSTVQSKHFLLISEKVNLGKIMTDIESVSKKMEKEKQLHLKKSG